MSEELRLSLDLEYYLEGELGANYTVVDLLEYTTDEECPSRAAIAVNFSKRLQSSNKDNVKLAISNRGMVAFNLHMEDCWMLDCFMETVRDTDGKNPVSALLYSIDQFNGSVMLIDMVD